MFNNFIGDRDYVVGYITIADFHLAYIGWALQRFYKHIEAKDKEEKYKNVWRVV